MVAMEFYSDGEELTFEAIDDETGDVVDG